MENPPEISFMLLTNYTPPPEHIDQNLRDPLFKVNAQLTLQQIKLKLQEYSLPEPPSATPPTILLCQSLFLAVRLVDHP